MTSTTNRYGTLATLISLFFLWGLLTSLNDILVPYFKKAFNLQNWQAQLVQLFFFAAYFVMAFPSGSVIKRFGYQRGIVIGLGLMALGCLIFYPAAEVEIFWVFLLGLFVLATGITILQVAANPYVVAVGPEDSGASRLNLAQGFNSFGHVLAPIVGTALILQENNQEGLSLVQTPYLVLAGILLVCAIVFSRIPLPNLETEDVAHTRGIIGFFRSHPFYILSMLAIFMYVGAEISVGSVLVNYLDEHLNIPNDRGGFFVSLYWGSAMLGRFMGSLALSSKAKTNRMAMFGLALAAIAIIFALPTAGLLYDYPVAIGLSAIILVNLLAFLVLPNNPSTVLAGFAAVNVVLLLLTMTTSGDLALYAVLGVGLFNSIMWSNIFALAIRGMKGQTTLASALLVTMIAGGAILPPLQGLLADATSLQLSFLVPVIAYTYLALYGLSRRKA